MIDLSYLKPPKEAHLVVHDCKQIVLPYNISFLHQDWPRKHIISKNLPQCVV